MEDDIIIIIIIMSLTEATGQPLVEGIVYADIHPMLLCLYNSLLPMSVVYKLHDTFSGFYAIMRIAEYNPAPYEWLFIQHGKIACLETPCTPHDNQSRLQPPITRHLRGSSRSVLEFGGFLIHVDPLGDRYGRHTPKRLALPHNVHCVSHSV